MRRLRLIALLLPLVGLLAACTITVQLPFPVTPTPVNANNPSGNASSVASFQLSPGASAYYEIDISSTQQTSYDVLQVELDQNLNLTLYGPSGNTISSSSSPDYFASSTLGLSSLGLAATTPSPQAITVNRTCSGSCIIQSLGSKTYYVRVENQTSSSATINLYAFVRYYDDSTEPGNNSRSGATYLQFGSSGDSGALETLGDQDYWQMATNGTFYFDASSATTTNIQPRADLYTSSGTFIMTLQPGDNTTVSTGDLVRVYALNNNRAGVSSASAYYVTLQ